MRLCEAGGGQQGGPPRTKVQQVLRAAGRSLNEFGYDEIGSHLAALPNHNPWHVCFAVGMSWGHLAKLDQTFTEASRKLDGGLELVRSADGMLIPHGARAGTDPRFSLGRLPALSEGEVAGWLAGESEIDRARPGTVAYADPLAPIGPKYIGSWNATAMFMVALFAQPKLAVTMVDQAFMLPPGGPIYNALTLLHRAHVLPDLPAGSELDDQSFEPGALYINNATMESLLKGLPDWGMLDVHSGLYMLGTRYPTVEPMAGLT